MCVLTYSFGLWSAGAKSNTTPMWPGFVFVCINLFLLVCQSMNVLAVETSLFSVCSWLHEETRKWSMQLQVWELKGNCLLSNPDAFNTLTQLPFQFQPHCNLTDVSLQVSSHFVIMILRSLFAMSSLAELRGNGSRASLSPSFTHRV